MVFSVFLLYNLLCLGVLGVSDGVLCVLLAVELAGGSGLGLCS